MKKFIYIEKGYSVYKKNNCSAEYKNNYIHEKT